MSNKSSKNGDHRVGGGGGNGVDDYNTKNPVVKDRPNMDPTQRFTKTTFVYGYKRLLTITRQNMGVWPIVFFVGLFVPVGTVWFIGYRVNNTPDVNVWHRKEPQPWNRFDNKEAKLYKLDQKAVLAKHPRPRFDYPSESQPKK